MTTPTISTPAHKTHAAAVSNRASGSRLQFTPSPQHRTASSNPGPTPSQHIGEHASINDESPMHTSLTGESSKSNVSGSSAGPHHALELGVSDFQLYGTAPHTPAAVKTKKSSSSRSKTAQASKATITHGADRFIANRGASSGIANAGSSKIDKPRVKKSSRNAAGSDSHSVPADDTMEAMDDLQIQDQEEFVRPSPRTVAYQDTLAKACDVDLSTRILQFKPAPPESSKPIDLRQQYNRPLKPTTNSAQFRRRIATAPERVLDAPGLVDDYYLNLLDWSSGNQVVIGLERSVYVWSADEGTVNCLMQTKPDTHVTSVKWSGDGAYVSVGLASGEVQIWDVAEECKIRSMFGHETRVSVMGWNKHLLSTGARSGLVFNHDVRIAEHKVAELVSHTAEVCGLEWRSDGAQLATGGNDNLVSIWDARSLTAPKFSKTNHKAAVKALSWCPWNMNLLATGGGAYDRHIHFWNTTSGARVNSIDTGSQVTSLRWSPHYREIVSTSGFPDNALSIWSYPTLVRNIEIPAHESRVLHSCLSPDGQMLATAAADESLKFWKIFEKKPVTASVSSMSSGKTEMSKSLTLR
ncbi:hypothetical protein TD95_004025 [Thielaviopsis punctulata]|uniref:CDC20/Fizzy WD40 domain-containing protein n=1 Tax=Thielaviopsis punctulata TaxID=72032 RepID=A0A0F4ZGD6_9PEZI|nr:hypothetical protein TD95_004025 [Thielaviopsis punctulata]